MQTAFRCSKPKRQVFRKSTTPVRCGRLRRYAGEKIVLRLGWYWNIWRWAGVHAVARQRWDPALPRCIISLPKNTDGRETTPSAQPRKLTYLRPTGLNSGVNTV